MEGEHRVLWGEGEDLDSFMRKVDAYKLAVGDEKKAVGKALLGLGSKIGVMDSLSEEDTKNVSSLKAALRREFGNSPQRYQQAFSQRKKLSGETYGMYLASLRNFFIGAFTDTPLDSAVTKALLKTRFLDGVDQAIASQLRLLFPDADVDSLPGHAKHVHEAVSTSGTSPAVSHIDETKGTGETGQVEQLQRQMAELSQSVMAIHDVVMGVNPQRVPVRVPLLAGGVASAPPPVARCLGASCSAVARPEADLARRQVLGHRAGTAAPSWRTGQGRRRVPPAGGGEQGFSAGLVEWLGTCNGNARALPLDGGGAGPLLWSAGDARITDTRNTTAR